MDCNGTFKSSIAGIDFWFDRNDGEPIPEEHQRLLTENARKDIGKWISAGWECGTLSDMISDEDNNDVEYDGWWGGSF